MDLTAIAEPSPIMLLIVRVMCVFVSEQSDQQANQVRRLQRSNDELQQQVDSLSIQLQHLQTRCVNLAANIWLLFTPSFTFCVLTLLVIDTVGLASCRVASL